MIPRYNHRLYALSKDVLIFLKQMLTYREQISLKLVFFSMHVLVEDYTHLIHTFFPDLSKELQEKKQRQQPLTQHYFLEEKYEQKISPSSQLIDYKKEYNDQYVTDYRGLSERNQKLFQLFKIGHLATIQEMTLTLQDLEIGLLSDAKVNKVNMVVDDNQRGLLEWAWIKGHQAILNYCYAIYKNYVDNIRAGFDSIHKYQDLIYAMLCHQAPDEVDRLLAVHSADKNYEFNLKNSETSTLAIASQYGYPNVVKALLLKKTDISESDKIVSMRLAINHDHLSIVQSLVVSYSAKSIELDNQYWLSLAIEYNRLEIFKYFFSLSLEEVSPSRLLQPAIKRNSIDFIYFILQNKATSLYQAIEEALQVKNTEVIKLIIATQKERQAKGVSEGFNVLTVALQQSNDDAAQYLIDNQLVDVNEVLDDGSTALFFAVRSKKIELVYLLVSQGADLKAVKNDGTTLLMEAALCKANDIFDFLLPQSDVGAKTCHDDTVLMYAVRGGCLQTVKTLVEKGMRIDVVSKYGDTLLSQAANHGSYEVVKFLGERREDNPAFIEHAIDVLQKLSLETFCAPHELRKSPYYQIVQYLLSDIAVMRAYFSNINLKKLCKYVMKIAQTSMLLALNRFDSKYNFLPLKSYFKDKDNAATVSDEEVLFANFLLLKSDQGATREQLIQWLDEFMGFAKFKDVVSQYFMNALNELKRTWRCGLGQEEKKIEPITITVSSASLDNHEPVRSQPKPKNLFSFFSKWCCHDDSALSDEEVKHQPLARGHG